MHARVMVEVIDAFNMRQPYIQTCTGAARAVMSIIDRSNVILQILLVPRLTLNYISTFYQLVQGNDLPL